MTHKPVLTKADFVKRYAAGEFGNASPTWHNVSSFLEEAAFGNLVTDSTQLYHLRSRSKGTATYYDLDYFDLYHKVERRLAWWDLHYYVSAMAPTHRTTLQGELRTGPNLPGDPLWDFTYSTRKAPMRQALAEETLRATGLTAKCIIQAAMNAVSYDWLFTLLNRYPGHVVEFSCYNTLWGTMPQYNTVFWEVRNY